jgi:Peptidase family M50
LNAAPRRAFVGVFFITLWPAFALGLSAAKTNALYLAGLLSGCLLYPFVLIAHELGHALTAWVLRLEVGAISIGFGPTLAKFELLSVPVQLHAWPLSGLVYLGSPSLRFLRMRLWITTLMGPMTNVLLVVITVHWWTTLQSHLGPSLPVVCVIVNLMVAVMNLVPRYAHDFGRTQRSDGLALLQILFTPTSKLRAYLFSAPLMRAVSCFEAGDFDAANSWLTRGLERVPGNSWLTVMQSACWSYVGKYAEARMSITPVVERSSSEDPLVRASAVNNLAFALLMQAPDAAPSNETMQKADQFSLESFEMYPCVLAYRSTRALVLAALGRCEEALRLLDYVHYRTASARERSNQGTARAFAFLKSGRAAEAREAANDAKRLDPTAFTFLPQLGLPVS